MDLGMVTPKGRASAAPARLSDDGLRNTEVEAAYEIGEWTRLTASEKTCLLVGLEPFKLFTPNSTLWVKLEAIARHQNLGIADVQVLVESLVPTSKFTKVQAILFGPRVPETWRDCCEAYSEYKEKVQEILGQG